MSNTFRVNADSNFTEFGYLEGFYLKLSYAQNIAITIYNLELLDGKRYETQMNLPSLFKLSNKFKKLETTKEIYEFIKKTIKENNFKITPNSNNKDNLTFSLIVKEGYIQSEIPFYLSNYDRKFGNYKHNIEYINILTNEITRLRNAKN